MFKNKFLKYKYKNKILENKIGGMITENDVLLKIISIGFEFETKDLSPLKRINDELHVKITDEQNRNYMINNDIDNQITFEVTNDYGSEPPINSKLTTNNSYIFCNRITEQVQPIIFPRNTNNEITQKFSHTEFIITFYSPTKSKNIIIEKFKEACKMIVGHINFLRKLIPGGEDIRLLKLSDGLHSLLSVQFFTDRNLNLEYANNKLSNNDILFTPQFTIKILLSSIIEVVSYLLNDENNNFNANIFDTCVLKSQKIIELFDQELDKICTNLPVASGLLDSLIERSPDLTVLHVEIREEHCNVEKRKQILDKLHNWLSLVFFYFEKYVLFVNNKQLYRYFKAAQPVLLRHHMHEICPLNLHIKLKTFFCETIKMLFNSENEKMLDYVVLLLEDNNKQMYRDGEEIIIDSTFFPYNQTNEEIMIEYRSFYKVMNILHNNDHKSIKLSEMKLLIK